MNNPEGAQTLFEFLVNDTSLNKILTTTTTKSIVLALEICFSVKNGILQAQRTQDHSPSSTPLINKHGNLVTSFRLRKYANIYTLP